MVGLTSIRIQGQFSSVMCYLAGDDHKVHQLLFDIEATEMCHTSR